MKKQSHTPGSWVALDGIQEGEISAGAIPIVDRMGVVNYDDGVGKANASLIAAAPDLLKAAKMVLNVTIKHSSELKLGLLALALANLSKAIAKAEGEGE